MRRFFAASVILAGFTPALCAFKVVGYFPSWSTDTAKIQYDKVTHINYAFILPTAAGGLSAMDNAPMLRAIIARAHARGVKVCISVGGWNNGDDANFEAIGASASLRTTFTQNLIALVDSYGLDGADIDWEYPDPGQSAANYSLFMQGLGTAFRNRSRVLLLSAAVVGNGTQGGGVLQTAIDAMDYVNIMAYDAGTPHSPYSYSVSTLDYWTTRGVPQDKRILGLPFYGRDPYVAYSDLVIQDSQAPYKDQVGNVYYNGITTIKRKTALAAQRGGGIMIWELSQDASGSISLLKAINDTLQFIPVALPGKPFTRKHLPRRRFDAVTLTGRVRVKS